MRTIVLIALCVAGWAASSSADDAPTLADGRWAGQFGGTSLASGRCSDHKNCTLTLDIIPCGEQWCGIRIDDAGGCTGNVLRLGSVSRPDNAQSYVGELKLMEGTAPYTLRAWMRKGDNGQPELRLIGDSGGKFLSRTFSFHAVLARTGDARCREIS